MSRFISIPVISGDCFYLENKEGNKLVSALVDGGAGNVQIKGKISVDKYLINIGINKLDVVVATHNDKDHTSGLKLILKNSNIKKENIYLPALWFDRLEDVLSSPKKFFFELLDDISNNQDNENNFQESDCSVENEESTVFDNLEYNELFDEQSIHIFRCPNCRIKLISKKKLNPIQSKKLDEALDALTNILDLYALAKNKNIKIHWFEFDTSNLSFNLASLPIGLSTILVPVNSRYITVPKKRKYRAYYWLQLTMVNKRALVFYHYSGNASALFSSDSLLDFNLPQMNNLLATVPHHGRDTNDSAVLKLIQNRNVIFVRNSHNRKDGKNMSHNYKSYTGDKYCDICFDIKGPISPSQLIEFTAASGGWSLFSSSKKCCCK